MQMSPGHLGSVQEESSSSTGDGCHGDRPVSARCFTFEEEVGTPEDASGMDDGL